MEAYQREFIEFLIKAGSLTFGDFTTKSGRKTPYFVNTGRFDTGELIAQLGEFYAQAMVANSLDSCDVVFGPAYKGIPLAVSTATALFRTHRRSVGVAFNRKEAKDHGDGGMIVGHKIADGQKIVLVEDVVTAGTTLNEVIPWLRQLAKVEVAGVVISVDRCERGSGALSAVAEAEQKLGIKIFPILTIRQIVQFLEERSVGQFVQIAADAPKQIRAYLEQYGA